MTASGRASSRPLDLLLGGALLLGSLPFQALIALAVRLDSRGPLFYQAVRCGRDGQPFRMLKFRSMVPQAPSQGPIITAGGDPRITRVGRFLRRTRLDELPQLWNVLRGDMSLVGPRPEDPRFVAHYTQEQREVLSVRPGISGLAQIEFRDEEQMLPADDPERFYIREILPRKLAIDLHYVRHRSARGDLRILARTLTAMLVRR